MQEANGAQQMSDLIKQLEALTEPCRECDSAISLAVDGYPFDVVMGELYGPAYTTSVDDAMTLVPKGWVIEALRFWPTATPASRVALWETEVGDGGLWWHKSKHTKTETEAATPAIALCIAALKARNAK